MLFYFGKRLFKPFSNEKINKQRAKYAQLMKREVAGLFLLVFTIAFFASLASGQALPKPVIEARCHDTGSFSVSNVEESGPITVKRSGSSSSSEISGSWREMSNGLMKFTSDEMAVVDVNGGYYTVKVDKSSYGATCPPFKFSCKLINLTINGCYKRNDTFVAKYAAYSFRYDKKNEFRFEKPFMLTYVAHALANGKKKELVNSPSVFSPEFERINISRIRRVGSNSYTVRWTTPLNVSRFIVRYDDCGSAKYSFYDSFECTQRPSCNKDSECLKTERCDDSLCIPISCAPCQYISNHSCADFDCCGDNDCGEGFVCGSGRKCKPLSCETNERVAGHGCEGLACQEDEYAFNHGCSKLDCGGDEVAVNHVCKKLECADDEAIKDRSCQKLKCGFLKKAINHRCVSAFSFK